MAEGLWTEFEIFWIWLVQGLYRCCAALYAFMIELASYEVISRLSIREMYLRVYTVIGIVMLFRIMYHMINYLIDPDKVEDKGDGASKIITRIITVFVMLAFCPLVFGLLMDLQRAILKDNLIAKLIGLDETMYVSLTTVTLPKIDKKDFGWFGIGNRTDKVGTTEIVVTQSQLMANSAMSVFITCKTDNCSLILNEQGGILNEEDSILAPEIYAKCAAVAKLTDLSGRIQLCKTVAAYPMLVSAGVFETAEDYLPIDFYWIPAFFFGIGLASLLGAICIDVAIRTIKLGILQLLAPVAIMMYVIPKGDESFKRWLAEVGKVYGDLFIRVAFIYLKFFIIRNAFSQNTGDGYLFIFIILGLLTIVKQGPKWIGEIFGAKDFGSGMNKGFFKRLGEVPYAGNASRAIGGLLGKTAGAVGSHYLKKAGHAFDKKFFGKNVLDKNGNPILNKKGKNEKESRFLKDPGSLNKNDLKQQAMANFGDALGDAFADADGKSTKFGEWAKKGMNSFSENYGKQRKIESQSEENLFTEGFGAAIGSPYDTDPKKRNAKGISTITEAIKDNPIDNKSQSPAAKNVIKEVDRIMKYQSEQIAEDPVTREIYKDENGNTTTYIKLMEKATRELPKELQAAAIEVKMAENYTKELTKTHDEVRITRDRVIAEHDTLVNDIKIQSDYLNTMKADYNIIDGADPASLTEEQRLIKTTYEDKRNEYTASQELLVESKKTVAKARENYEDIDIQLSQTSKKYNSLKVKAIEKLIKEKKYDNYVIKKAEEFTGITLGKKD